MKLIALGLIAATVAGTAFAAAIPANGEPAALAGRNWASPRASGDNWGKPSPQPLASDDNWGKPSPQPLATGDNWGKPSPEPLDERDSETSSEGQNPTGIRLPRGN
ncbi:hypothetical protein BJ138DRAFT_1155454 [Hygrophoropsis aurantiaca]|uniref:Uncharacterized protein n=1 Tax=Hygrophoropsis aurantiaca TaxID=72124 RepID=A0ACB8A8K5_9AGAM|nr:hypothetical protein BJ138DRAFT_1155454 [Hygrophoropsis aurantiaca]